MMLAVKDRFSAQADCGDLLKGLSVEPAGMSGSKFFEQSLSTQSRHTRLSKADLRHHLSIGMPVSSHSPRWLELLNEIDKLL